MPWATLQRRLRQARRARVAGLIAMGRTRQEATTQVNEEFSHYDRQETDERGWVRLPGLTLDEPPE